MNQRCPLDEQQCGQVIRRTEEIVQRLAQELGMDLPMIPVLFDLRGRSAGMYRVKKNQRVIRYNPRLFSRYYRENLEGTVPHEAAHYAVDMLYGTARTRPHGREWQAVMRLLGADPRVTCDFDMSDIPQRRYRRFGYRCICRRHELTSIRHHRVLRGARYYCRVCKQLLVAAER